MNCVEVNAILSKVESVPNQGPPPAGLTQGRSREIVDVVLKSLDDDKGEDIVVIDLAGKTTIADTMIIASGRSSRQVAAMADHLVEKLKRVGLPSVPVEGKASGDWVLIDAGDAIVHLFRPEVRAFYNIEKMWADDQPAFAAGGGEGDGQSGSVVSGGGFTPLRA